MIAKDNPRWKAMARGTHSAWCARRAADYLSRNEVGNALGQLGADLARDPETKGLIGKFSTLPVEKRAVEQFIEENLL
jgi:hypothetical protein